MSEEFGRRIAANDRFVADAVTENDRNAVRITYIPNSGVDRKGQINEAAEAMAQIQQAIAKECPGTTILLLNISELDTIASLVETIQGLFGYIGIGINMVKLVTLMAHWDSIILYDDENGEEVSRILPTLKRMAGANENKFKFATGFDAAVSKALTTPQKK